MIPDIRRWVYQPNQEAITFHMAQALTGHGCFQHYLWKRRRAGDPHCMHCGEPDDTVEHTLFNCPFWAEDRREMEQCIGRPLQPNDVPDIILGPEQELLPDDASRRRRIETMAEGLRLAFGRMVEAILGRKEDAERCYIYANEVGMTYAEITKLYNISFSQKTTFSSLLTSIYSA
ncbi:hypothetical protein QTP88_007528 [Uroleucon formosanum]